MLTQFTSWLWSLIVGIVQPMWDFVQDAFIAVVDGIVSAFVALVVAIPVPNWLAGGLSQTWNGLDGGVLFFVTQAGVPAALAIIGAGYVFRLIRKFATLFQW
jgi:hypothetical protein